MSVALVLTIVGNPRTDIPVYSQYVKNNDIENYRNLWDDQFVGWPRFSESPIGKEKIVDWIAPLHKNPDEVFDYELTRKAVRSFGDIVVVQYLVREFMRSKDKMVEIKPWLPPGLPIPGKEKEKHGRSLPACLGCSQLYKPK